MSGPASPSADRQVAKLTQIAHAVRAEVLRTHHDRSCLMSTRVLIETAKYFGVYAKPVPVKTAFLNGAAIAAMEQELPLEQWPDDAWSVGIEGTGQKGVRNDPKGWDGHMVAVTKTVLVDPSADQMSRPEKGMPLEAFAAPIPTEWSTGDQPTVFRAGGPGGLVLIYTPMTTPGPWRDSPDWSGHRQIATEATAAAIRVLRDNPTVTG